MGTNDRFNQCVMVFLVLLVAGGTALGVVGAQPDDEFDGGHDSARNASIEEVIPTGPGYVDDQMELVRDHPGPAFVWQNASLHLDLDLYLTGEDRFDLCPRVYDQQGERLGIGACEAVSVNDTAVVEGSVPLSPFPADAAGNHTVIMELRTADGEDEEATISEAVTEVFVMTEEGDLAGNGLSNAEEVRLGTDFTRKDTLGNGLSDYEEVAIYGTDPLEPDTTGDGISDAMLVRLRLDPTTPYIAHMYAVGIIALQLLVILGIVVTRRHFAASDDDGGWTISEDDAEVPTNGTTNHDSASIQELDTDRMAPLTNEEYVLELLEENDGRLKQKVIVETTDWSKAKVSRVLSDLQDQGLIRKIRIGRENVIDLEADGIRELD